MKHTLRELESISRVSSMLLKDLESVDDTIDCSEIELRNTETSEDDAISTIDNVDSKIDSLPDVLAMRASTKKKRASH